MLFVLTFFTLLLLLFGGDNPQLRQKSVKAEQKCKLPPQVKIDNFVEVVNLKRPQVGCLYKKAGVGKTPSQVNFDETEIIDKFNRIVGIIGFDRVVNKLLSTCFTMKQVNYFLFGLYYFFIKLILSYIY